MVEEGDVQVARHGRQGQRPRVSPFAADVGHGDADLARVSKGYDAVGVHAMVVDAVGNPEGVHHAPGPLQRVVAEGDAEAVEQSSSTRPRRASSSSLLVEDSVNAQSILLLNFIKEYSKVVLFILFKGKVVDRNDNK